MVVQEWSESEIEAIKALGFVLNFKNYFVKDKLTLTKRLDLEFNEMFYQAYDDNGMQINIPAYRVSNAFESYMASLNDLLTVEIINFDKLMEWCNSNNMPCTIETDKKNNRYVINFANKEYILDSLDYDVERHVLYLVINKLIFS